MTKIQPTGLLFWTAVLPKIFTPNQPQTYHKSAPSVPKNSGQNWNKKKPLNDTKTALNKDAKGGSEQNFLLTAVSTQERDEMDDFVSKRSSVLCLVTNEN